MKKWMSRWVMGTLLVVATTVRAGAQGSLPGDANGDCIVSGADYAIWLTHYQQSTANGFRDGDFNGDGTVTGVDYAIWLAHYRQTCSGPTPTPPVGATNTPTPSRTPTPGGPTSTPVPTLPPGTGLYDWGPFGTPPDPSAPNADKTWIPIEIQAWWNPVPDDKKGFGHEHVMCKWPIGQVVSGSLKTYCRITFHDNPSRFNSLTFHWAPGDVIQHNPRNFTCPYDGVNSTNCSVEIPVTIPVSGSGWRHLRIRARMDTADGKVWTTSSELPLAVGCTPDANGNGCGGGEFPNCNIDGGAACLVAKSWYTGVGYKNAKIRGIPLRPIRRGEALTLIISNDLAGARMLSAFLDRSHFIPATEHWPAEPSLPTDPPGWPKLFPNPPEDKDYTVSIDTSSLALGWHSFAVRSEGNSPVNSSCGSVCNYTVTNPNFQTGVAKFWFYVE